MFSQHRRDDVSNVQSLRYLRIREQILGLGHLGTLGQPYEIEESARTSYGKPLAPYRSGQVVSSTPKEPVLTSPTTVKFLS